MGKTYRNVKGAYKENGERNWERRVRQPDVITPEWAMKMTKPRIEHALQELVVQEVIDQCEVKDYFWIITERVVNAIEKYDPNRRNAEGRTASALNYLLTTVENSVANIIERERRQIRDGEEVPISKLPPEEAKVLGYVSENDVRFSDGCTSVKILEFRMDINTLVGLLTVDELLVLRLRLAGYTVSELSRQLAIPRMTVVRKLMPSIAVKAQHCGFFSGQRSERGA